MKARILLLITLLIGVSASAQWGHLKSGDLLFVSDTTGMGQAVKESTGQYTHVALVERVGDSLFIIDAPQKHGVSRRPIETTFAHRMPVEAYRLTIHFDTAAVIKRAHGFLGQLYDNAFLPNNGALYCSELIYECFLDADGKHLFEAHPMNWRNAKGELPAYWVEHFHRIGTNVPEGVMGTNPTDLSHSPLLFRQ